MAAEEIRANAALVLSEREGDGHIRRRQKPTKKSRTAREAVPRGQDVSPSLLRGHDEAPEEAGVQLNIISDTHV